MVLRKTIEDKITKGSKANLYLQLFIRFYFQSKNEVLNYVYCIVQADGVIGIGIAATAVTAVGLLAGGIVAALSRKK